MSKHEVAEFNKLLRDWQRLGSERSRGRLLRFLDMYGASITSALELAAR